MTGGAAVRGAGVSLAGVRRLFGDHVVLDGLDLELPPGEVTALMGPNGSGKTTVGRIVLGLDTPDAGEVRGVAGRRVGAVFQEDRLWGHLSATGNVALVLERGQRVLAASELTKVGIDGPTAATLASELSGGQRRRVAIVRALVSDAEVVVLDEPFTGIDAAAKPLVMEYVLEAVRGRTTLLVTHDVAEAAFFDARVVRLERHERGARAR